MNDFIKYNIDFNNFCNCRKEDRSCLNCELEKNFDLKYPCEDIYNLLLDYNKLKMQYNALYAQYKLKNIKGIGEN